MLIFPRSSSRRLVLSVIYALGILGIVASGGGSGGDGDAPSTAATPTLDFDIKTFRFTWTDVGDATHYRLLENPDGLSGFSNVSADIPQGTQTFDHVVPLYKRVSASYILQSCNEHGCTDSSTILIIGTLVDAIGYFKASNTDTGDVFGESVSLSDDGNTLAVGAIGEDSNATGINGNESDNSASTAGAVYVFTKIGNNWNQQAYIKASNTDSGDEFGFFVSLSADGNTLAVGARREASSTNGINTVPNNLATRAGAVYVFTRSGISWTQEAYIKASNTDAFDEFGSSVSLSDDGDTLAVGAVFESSNATGINGNQADNSEGGAGAVYVFNRSGIVWTQEAYIKASNTDAGDNFGNSVSLSDDGNTLAVGAINEDSNATGINGNQADNSNIDAGAVFVLARSGFTWTQEAYVKASNTDAGDNFGNSVSLSDDGNTLAVGAFHEGSSTSGINTTPDDLANWAGAVYVFTRGGVTWTQEAYVKASNTDAGDIFGASVSLSGDGNNLAVGAVFEDSESIGIEGNQLDNSEGNSGAVYVFTRNGNLWDQEAYVKASNTENGDSFGFKVSMSMFGNTLAIGVDTENSNATGIGGNQADNSAVNAGALYLY